MSESSVSRFSKVRSLSDAPATADELSGGAHDRVATALASVIRDSTDSGKSIGLEGGWGSGKSSVVDITAKKLRNESDKNKRAHVFIFDLWAHQEDPLRRAFLEQFVEWLKSEKIISAENYAKWISKVRARIRETRTETTRELSIVGIVAVLSTP